jgi:hypothetical protein
MPEVQVCTGTNFTRPEDTLAQPSPNPKFIFEYVTRIAPKRDFLLLQPE